MNTKRHDRIHQIKVVRVCVFFFFFFKIHYMSLKKTLTPSLSITKLSTKSFYLISVLETKVYYLEIQSKLIGATYESYLMLIKTFHHVFNTTFYLYFWAGNIPKTFSCNKSSPTTVLYEFHVHHYAWRTRFVSPCILISLRGRPSVSFLISIMKVF